MKSLFVSILVTGLFVNSCTLYHTYQPPTLSNEEMARLLRHTISEILFDKYKKFSYGGYICDKSGLLFYYEADLDTLFFEFSGFIKNSLTQQIDSGYFKMSIYGKNFYFFIYDENFSGQKINSVYKYIDQSGDTVSLYYNYQKNSLYSNRYFTLETYAFYLLALKDFYNKHNIKKYLSLIKTPNTRGFYIICLQQLLFFSLQLKRLLL